MGFFDNLFNGSSDPRRSAQIRGGMLGAAQALLRPYSGFGDALTGAGMGALQGKQDYITEQYHDLRNQQLQDEIKRTAAQKAALNNLFLGTKPAVTDTPAPMNMAQHQAPAGDFGQNYETMPAPTQQAPQAQSRVPPGFESPEQFQAFAEAFPEEAAKLMFAPPPKPIVGRPGDVFLDPVTHQQVGSVPDRDTAPKTTGGMFWNDQTKRYEAIPGYEDQQRRIAAAGRSPASADGWRDMSREEKIAKGLPADAAFQVNTKGKIERIGGNNSVRPIPGSALAGIQGNRLAISKIDRAIAAIRANPDALGAKNVLPDAVTQRIPGKGFSGGVDVRSLIADIGSLKIHDRSGAAVTAAETPRLKPFIPSVADTPEAAITKLQQLKMDPMANLDEAQAFYSPESGYMSIPEPANASQSPATAPGPTPPPDAIRQLKMMGPKGAPQFDEIFGKGAAAKYLGKK